MGNADWTLGQLEHDLAAGFDFLSRAERQGDLGRGEASAIADGVMRCMNGALMKVSESLEAQAALRRELAEAREELATLRQWQSDRISGLEGEVQALRRALCDERRRIDRLGASSPCTQPDREYLSRPLVMRSPQGEFLGITDRAGQALSLEGFLRLVDGPGRGRAPLGRQVASCWDGDESGWSLSVSVSSPASRRHYVLATRQLRTPSGNLVTLLCGLHVDGRLVPADFVQQMFRQLRDSLQEN